MASGRWHSQGKRIVYLADHPSSALLESWSIWTAICFRPPTNYCESFFPWES
jgi:RES domain-containing protein